MNKFVGFAIGVAIFVAYVVVAAFIGNAATNVAPDAGLICLGLAIAGWIALGFVALRRSNSWIGYGIIAAPFLALLLITVSCFVLIGVDRVT